MALDLRLDEFNGTWFTTWPCSHLCLPLEEPKRNLGYKKEKRRKEEESLGKKKKRGRKKKKKGKWNKNKENIEVFAMVLEESLGRRELE